MVGDADHWYTQTSKYLVDRANETGQQSALGKAEAEFWTYSKGAAQTNPILLASVDDQATQFAADWATMLADASSDAAVHGASPLGVSGLDTYAQKRAFWGGALATLEGLLDLFVGTAHAEEFEQQVRREIDDAVAGIQSVVIRQGRPANPFASLDFDPDASISLGALAAGSARTFTLYLPYDAGSGGQRVNLTLAGGAADMLALLDHAGEVALGPDGAFTLLVPEGRRELSFGLRAKQDIAGGAMLGLSAQLVDAQNVATHSAHLELNLALDGAGAALPVTSREIRGDWEAKPWTDPATGITYAYRLDDLGNVERQTDVPATRAWGPEQFLRGSSGADHMVTGNFVVQAFGDAGDDFILGSDDSGNYLAGGAGSDRIEGGGWADHAAEYLELDLLGRTIGLGDDKIYGGAGDDSIWGEREATQAELDDPGAEPTGLPGDWLTGGSGSDRIYGSAGNDVLLGGTGEDLLVGGAGMDVLLGDDDFQIRPESNYWRVLHPNFGNATPGSGVFELGLFPVVSTLLSYPDLVWGTTGDPYFAYYKHGGGPDVLIGGAGDDILIGEYGDDTLYGGEGNDILAGWEGDDELIGGVGDDLMAGDLGRYERPDQRTISESLLVGAGSLPAGGNSGAVEQTGNDLLDGGDGDDVLYGEGGDDSLIGGDGDDVLYGDADYLPEELHGDDMLDGGEGDDSLFGGAGKDSLYGGAGNDDLFGGPGDDLLEGGSGIDVLDGGQGDDTLRAGDGDDELSGGDGADELRAGAGDDELDGGDGDDILYGESGADVLNGGAGDDRLYGGTGDDTIAGGDGDDWLEGGAGSDLLRGGAGDDSYLLGFGAGRDVIEDDEGANRIRFDSGTLPEDLRAELDDETLVATLAYSPVGDTVSIDMSGFELGGIDFAGGEAWGAKQFAALLPALQWHGWDGDDVFEGRANLRNALHGGGGDDMLTGGGWDDLLEGGDGNDRADGAGGSDVYYFSGSESGIDRIEDSGIDASAYLDAYYAALGIPDWRSRGAHGGTYRAVVPGDGRDDEVYYDSYDEAFARYPDAAIDFIEPLPALAPAVQRDDDAALEALFAAGTVARDTVRFGPGVALSDLALRIAVPLASAEAH
ncbi:MAG: calcium-binding protein, partial [Burkholderiales bacterium]